MATGKITIIQENTASGGITGVERTTLYIGTGGASAITDVVHTIGAQTDLDAILGEEDSDLKTQIVAAALNAGPNFTAWVIALDSLTWDAAVEFALDAANDIYPEKVAITDAITTGTEVDALQAAAVAAAKTYGKYITMHAACPGIDPATQTWADYMAATKAINNGKACDRVAIIPQLHGNNLGVVLGRLDSDAVSIADTPMRVRTGSVIGLGAAPVDSADQTLTMAHLSELSDARFSVPGWYTEFDGIYWSDHMLLDAAGGDFQVYENMRVMDYITRRVRVLMIRKIADRSLNSSKSSTAYHEEFFMEPIRTAAKGTTINGEPKPGLVKPPEKGDITITWETNTAVQLAILAAPVECPKKITTRIALDLTRLGA